jgi:hypothetical protein
LVKIAIAWRVSSLAYLIFILYCKMAEPNSAIIGRVGPCEVEIQICLNEADPPWGGAIREPKIDNLSKR